MELIAFCLTAATAYIDGRECRHAVDVLPPCKYEDSADCFWHAPTMGNGVGRSFVDIDGLLFTWDGVVSDGVAQ